MAEVLEFAKPGAPAPCADGFVITESAQDMLRSLQLVRAAGNAITLIAATPGTGKTEVLKHFAAGQNAEKIDSEGRYKPDEVFLHTAVAGEGTPWGLAGQLMQAWNLGKPNSRRLTETRQLIGRCVGKGGLLMIDEAQYLVQRNTRGKDTWDSLEWLRAMAEEGEFSIAYCGDLALLEIRLRLPQLWRRMLESRPVVIKAVSKRDVELLMHAKGVNEPKVLNILYRVSRRGGGLGVVNGVFKHACRMAGGTLPGLAHIMAALDDLNLLSREDQE